MAARAEGIGRGGRGRSEPAAHVRAHGAPYGPFHLSLRAEKGFPGALPFQPGGGRGVVEGARPCPQGLALFFLEPSESLRLSHGLRSELPWPRPSAVLSTAPACHTPVPDPGQVASASRARCPGQAGPSRQ